MPVVTKPVSRRRFLRASVQTGALVAAPPFIPGSVLGKDGAVPPSDRVVLGAIGIGNRGREVLLSFLNQPDVRFVAVCDIRAERRDAVKKMADEVYENTDCVRYSDLHEILARADIDAVLIATGDRW